MLSGLSLSAGFCFIWEHMQSEARGGKKETTGNILFVSGSQTIYGKQELFFHTGTNNTVGFPGNSVADE